MIEGIAWALLVGGSAAVGVAIRQLIFAQKWFRPPLYSKTTASEADLPSVTVCVPARNEAHALSDCLETVLSSDYPKLEIIVLDDSSVDGTSNLIKSFAHSGVRFVAGSSLPSGWIGKNYALEGLLKEASGSVILYLDVDTRLRTHTISQLVSYMMQEKATMVSVAPRREDGWRFSVLFSPLRYFWELMFHYRGAPAVSGNAWLIKRRALKEYGGFSFLKDAVAPEAHLASYFAHRHGYRFLVGSRELGVSYEKKWSSQLATSVRLLYPTLGGQWAMTVVAALGLLLLLAPFGVIATVNIFSYSLGIIIAAVLLVVVMMALYTLYARMVWRSGWWLAPVLVSLILIQECILVIASFIQYHRGRVTWKGRPLRSEVQS